MSHNEKLLLPSMMCADFGYLRDELNALEAAGADGLHLDLMDGNFVPNYGMGLQGIEWLCKNATIPCDVHMMVGGPGATYRSSPPWAFASSTCTLRPIRTWRAP